MVAWYIALAQAAPGNPQQSFWPTLSMLAVIFAIFYFLLIRPQQRQLKEHKAMLSALQKGDAILFAGGVHGRVVEVGERTLVVEIADKVRVKINREAVAGKLVKDGAEAVSPKKSG